MKKLFVSAFTTLLLVVGFLHVSTTTALAQTLRLVPASTTLTPGSAVSLDLEMTTASQEVTSYAIALDVTGASVPADLGVTSQTPTGMNLQDATVITITGGKQIQLIVTGGGASGTINTGGSYVKIGTITFTVPASGSSAFNLNPGSTVFAGATGNILTGTIAETYTYGGGTPSPTPTPSPSPTPTPAPSPTPSPSPTPTPPPTPADVTMTFRLQGINSGVGSQTATLTIKEDGPVIKVGQGDGGVVLGTTTATATPDSQGVHSATFTNLPSGTYKLCLKAKSHLQKCWTGVTLTAGANTLDKSVDFLDELQAGDVTGVGNNNNEADNLITSDDLAYVSSGCAQFICTAPAGDVRDVNNDGRFTVDDLAITILNFVQFEIPGDE